MNIDACSILDAIDQYVFCKDLSSTYIYANEPFALLAGAQSKEAIIGKTDFDLVWKQDAVDYQLCDQQVISGKPLIKTEKIQHRGSASARIMLTKIPLRGPDGNIIGVLGNFFDCQHRLILEATGKFDEEKHRLYLEFVPEWLSFTEVRVCFYLIHGFSAQRISEKTGTSISTVRYHIENIKNKMQCSNKSEIAEVAMRTGIAWKIFTLQHVNEAMSER